MKTFQGEQQDAIAAIMAQLSLNEGFKEWVNKSDKAVHSDMNQLHFRETLEPMHCK